MRILAMGDQALMEGFALLGVETFTDPPLTEVEQTLTELERRQQRALIYLQQSLAHADLPVLHRLREEGGHILIAEVPALHQPKERLSAVDQLVTRVMGASVLEPRHEQ